ncbi:unnamed protein product [Phytophthora lilii]|uniref:Unnamed protein product n=1 Tax=Phytophthora lilii TaxID=2077276 RepID=A0A9W6TBS7_9STRA|nr:unnamed protein product [Phytophthora lilii]
MLASRDLGFFGEPIIAERKIRIGDLSSGSFLDAEHRSNQDEFEHDESYNREEQPQGPSELSDDISDSDETESDIQAFRTMLADPDAERLNRLQQMQEERQRRAAEAAAEEQKRLEKAVASTAEWDYIAALQRAKKMDFTDLKALEFCYCGGVDLAGLPVIVYLAGKLRVEDVDMERVLLFVLLTLDSQRASLTATAPQFNLLYVHSDVTDENQPPTAWLKRLFRVFTAVAAHRAPSDRPLHSKGTDSVLRFFYVLGPSFGFKFQLLLSKGYCDGGGFYNQVVYLRNAETLDSIAPKLQLPSHIYSLVTASTSTPAARSQRIAHPILQQEYQTQHEPLERSTAESQRQEAAREDPPVPLQSHWKWKESRKESHSGRKLWIHCNVRTRQRHEGCDRGESPSS